MGRDILELHNHLKLLLEMLHSAADKLDPTFLCRKETKLAQNTQYIYVKYRHLFNKNTMLEITYQLLNLKSFYKFVHATI